jgi:hypothetical protein
MTTGLQSVFTPEVGNGSGSIRFGGNGFTGILNVALGGGNGLVLYDTSGGQPTMILPQGESQLPIGPNQLIMAWSGSGYKLAWWL